MEGEGDYLGEIKEGGNMEGRLRGVGRQELRRERGRELEVRRGGRGREGEKWPRAKDALEEKGSSVAQQEDR